MRIALKLAFTLVVFCSFAQKWEHGRVVVAGDGHHLVYEDGTPFFWLGDTAWELFHRLDRAEIKTYLENRKTKGFNVIQAVVLAEFDGLKKPNRENQLPLQNLDPTKPNEKYFELIDATIRMAAERGLIMGLLPTWGDKVAKMWGEGPVVFNESNAMIYGEWIGKRFKNNPNIIWILGGDRQPTDGSNDWRPIWNAMATGILKATEKKALISYHISGGEKSTSQTLHQENWLHINMMQSGHGSGHDVPVWNWISRDYNLKPVKPTLDSEPNYEDHPVNPWPKYDPVNGYFNDYDVRKQTYRSVFSGGCGVTYGHHSVWQFWSAREEKINFAKMFWMEALDRPGAFQVGYLRRLMESRPFQQTVPGQELILSGQDEKSGQIRVLRSKDSSFAMIYLPIGKEVVINTTLITGEKIKIWWFEPKTGKSQFAGVVDKKNKMNFIAPTAGEGNDWVLLLEDASFSFNDPGRVSTF